MHAEAGSVNAPLKQKKAEKLGLPLKAELEAEN